MFTTIRRVTVMFTDNDGRKVRSLGIVNIYTRFLQEHVCKHFVYIHVSVRKQGISLIFSLVIASYEYLCIS